MLNTKRREGYESVVVDEVGGVIEWDWEGFSPKRRDRCSSIVDMLLVLDYGFELMGVWRLRLEGFS